MTTPSTDARLVATFLAGDPNALAKIHDRYAPGLFDTAASMLNDRHDAADVVQEVFCVAAERLDQLRDHDRLKPWLYAILRNEVYRRTKRRRRLVPTDFGADSVYEIAAATDPQADGASVSYAELAQLVRSAAAGLDERDRFILELSVRQGLRGTDLAEALGIAPTQVYSVVHRMRERVETSLGAFVVAKTGRARCHELNSLVSDWNGEFNVLLRKRLVRHIEDCRMCLQTRAAYDPFDLFGAAPIFVLPLGSRDTTIAAARNILGPGQSGDPLVEAAATQWPRSKSAGIASSETPPRRANLSRQVLNVATSTTAVVILTAATVLLSPDDDAADHLLVDSITIDSSSSIVPETLAVPTPATNSAIAISIDPPPAVDDDPLQPQTPATPGTPATAPTPDSVEDDPSAPSTIMQSTFPLLLSKTTLNFAFGTTASLMLTNSNRDAAAWSISESSGLFSFDPASGSLESGSTLLVTTTFARSTTSDVAPQHSSSLLLAEGQFSLPAALVSSGSGPVAVTLIGVVGRPPIISTINSSFAGPMCSSLQLQVPVTDESPMSSVSALIAHTGPNNTNTAPSFTISLSELGGGLWTATVTDIPLSTAHTTVHVTATDKYSFETTVSHQFGRPNSC